MWDMYTINGYTTLYKRFIVLFQIFIMYPIHKAKSQGFVYLSKHIE